MTEEEYLAVRSAIRHAMRRPLLVLRERQKRIERLNERMLALARRLERAEYVLARQARDVTSPLVVINMLAVEALCILEQRTSKRRPRHYRAIRRALALVEQLTAADMAESAQVVLYGEDDFLGLDDEGDGAGDGITCNEPDRLQTERRGEDDSQDLANTRAGM